jgi:hypothetical protein
MTLTETPFLLNGQYDVAAIMKAAHSAARRLWDVKGFDNYHTALGFYLRQKWIMAQHQMSAYRAIFAQPTIVREGTLAYAHYARD